MNYRARESARNAQGSLVLVRRHPSGPLLLACKTRNDESSHQSEKQVRDENPPACHGGHEGPDNGQNHIRHEPYPRAKRQPRQNFLACSRAQSTPDEYKDHAKHGRLLEGSSQKLHYIGQPAMMMSMLPLR